MPADETAALADAWKRKGIGGSNLAHKAGKAAYEHPDIPAALAHENSMTRRPRLSLTRDETIIDARRRDALSGVRSSQPLGRATPPRVSAAFLAGH